MPELAFEGVWFMGPWGHLVPSSEHSESWLLHAQWSINCIRDDGSPRDITCFMWIWGNGNINYSTCEAKEFWAAIERKVKISVDDRNKMAWSSGGAVATNRSDAPNLKEPLWFWFARMTKGEAWTRNGLGMDSWTENSPKACLTDFPTGLHVSSPCLRLPREFVPWWLGDSIWKVLSWLQFWPEYLWLSRRHYGYMSTTLKQHKSPCIPLMIAAKARSPLNQANPKATYPTGLQAKPGSFACLSSIVTIIAWGIIVSSSLDNKCLFLR